MGSCARKLSSRHERSWRGTAYLPRYFPAHIMQLDIHEVFLLDSEFKIERPTRYYRQGLRAMHLEDKDDDDNVDGPSKHSHRISKLLHLHEHSHPTDEDEHSHRGRADKRSSTHEDGTASEPRPSTHDTEDTAVNESHRHNTVRSKRSQRSHIRRSSVSTARSTILGRLRSIRSGKTGSRRHSDSSDTASSHSSSSSASSDHVEPAYKDPSTHVNIMTNKHSVGDEGKTDEKQQEKDLSHHTFFIENSQMRLKLVARTEVSFRPANCP